MSGMVIPYFPSQPVRLRARRRSRCCDCDRSMTKRPYGWWCANCKHVVTYSAAAQQEEQT